MRKVTLILMSAVFVAAVFIGPVYAGDSTKAEPAKKHDYIGDKKCRICHKDEHASWSETVHANAFDLLKPEEQKNEECVGCHTTGTTAKGELLEGVQCEACHGPGSDYKKKSVMEDREAALASGLILPTEEVCVGCHNKKSPTFKGFDFEKASKDTKAIHKMKSKEVKESEKKG